jgi:hypothetical protein
MLSEEKIVELLDSLHEHKMAKDIFVPVLKKMGLKGVKYTGGQDENGIDIEYYQFTEPDKVKFYVGVQFKKGNLVYGAGGSKNTVKEIKNQAEEAFEKEIHDIEGVSTHFISRFIAATTGEINEKARVVIGKARQKNKERQIGYWPSTVLAEYIQNHWMAEFEKYFSEQLEGEEEEIDSEAIVDSEYITENYQDLIENVKKVERIVNGFEWEILQIVGRISFETDSRVSMADFLFELGQTEEYCSEEFHHLASLQLLDIDEDGLRLTGHATFINDLYTVIASELEDANENPSEIFDIYKETIK